MSYPSFTAGDVLGAADMNAVGMWLVKSQTIGSGVSTISVTGAFSSNWDNYRIIISGGVASGLGSGTLQLNNSVGSTYKLFGYFGTYGTAVLNPYSPTANTRWSDLFYTDTTGYACHIDLYNPFLTKPTLGSCWAVSTTGVYHFAMQDTSTASSTGFTITQLGGATFTGGTIRIYGYRN